MHFCDVCHLHGFGKMAVADGLSVCLLREHQHRRRCSARLAAYEAYDCCPLVSYWVQTKRELESVIYFFVSDTALPFYR